MTDLVRPNAHGGYDTFWSDSDQTDNTVINLTRAAQAGHQHVVKTIDVSYDSDAAGTVTIKEGGVAVAVFNFSSPRDINLNDGFILAEGAALDVELSSSGAGGNKGSLTITGVTVNSV